MKGEYSRKRRSSDNQKDDFLVWENDIRLLGERGGIVGVDEAGRGPLAGPVTAAACFLEKEFLHEQKDMLQSWGVNDSKKLKQAQREKIYDSIHQCRAGIAFFIAEASVAEIEAHNILGATTLAMRRAIEGLLATLGSWEIDSALREGDLFQPKKSDRLCRVIIDGRPVKGLGIPHEAIIKGDGKSLSIGLASILAKVHRDQAMKAWAKKYPQYGLERHAGYGTKAHCEAILTHGPTPIHRPSFLKKILSSH